MSEEEIKFRNYDMERAFIRKRNHECSRRILQQAGIKKDNPDYKSFYRATMIYVNDIYRFSYNGETEEQLNSNFDTLVVQLQKGISAQEYQNNILPTRRQRAMLQFEKAEGSGVSVFRYQNIMDILHETIRDGIEVRHNEKFTYPQEFYDEKGRLMDRIIMDIPLSMQSESAMYNIEMLLSKHSNMKIEFEDNNFIVNGQRIGPQRFFSSKSQLIDRFFAKLMDDYKRLDMEDSELMQTIASGDYKLFVQLHKTRGSTGDKRNEWLRQVLKDEVIFDDLSAQLKGQNINRQHMLSVLKNLSAEYQKDAEIVKKESEKTTLGRINRVMLTIAPYDIATQSTLRNWRSCMHTHGLHHEYVYLNIGLGTIVAYGYDSAQPQKMISRILLHPFQSLKGEVAYRANRRIYGRENLGFRMAVEKCVDHFNRGKNGIYDFHPELYSEDAVAVLNLRDKVKKTSAGR